MREAGSDHRSSLAGSPMTLRQVIQRAISFVFRQPAGIGVLSAVLASATLVTIARIAAPFEVGKDQAAQLEAAQRLIDGLGLTTTSNAIPVSPDLSVEPIAPHLTWWPPGLSLIVAGAMLTGAPLWLALRAIYSVATLAGWLGWGIAASLFFGSGWLRNPSRFACFFCALLPVFMTPNWRGTDILLWAGIPFIVLLLMKSANRRGFALVFAAGLLFGLLCAVRYTSLFIGLAALLILLQVSLPSVKLFIKKATVFYLASLIIIVPVGLYVRLYSQSGGYLPGPAIPQAGGWISLGEIARILEGAFVTSNLTLGFPVLEQVLYKAHSSALNYLCGSLSMLIIFSLPVALLWNNLRNRKKVSFDFALSFSLLPPSLTLFLILTSLVTKSEVFGVRRYYEPLALCCVLIFYHLAARRSSRPVLRFVPAGLFALFALYIFLYLPGIAFFPERRDFLAQTVLSFTPARSPRYPSTSSDISYPSLEVFSTKEQSRIKLRELHLANPESLFFVDDLSLYTYDRMRGEGPAPGRELRDSVSESFWSRAYSTLPRKVFLVLNVKTQPQFLLDPNHPPIHVDPFERTKIIETIFPRDYLYALADRTGDVNAQSPREP